MFDVTLKITFLYNICVHFSHSSHMDTLIIPFCLFNKTNLIISWMEFPILPPLYSSFAYPLCWPTIYTSPNSIVGP